MQELPRTDGSQPYSAGPNRPKEEALASLQAGALRVEQAPETHRRRAELVDHATTVLGDRDFSEFVYDVAVAEAVDPGLAFELVFSGLAVCEPRESGLENQEILVETAPEWVQAPPVFDAVAQRERRLRSSLRRLRHMVENSSSIEAALAAYADEPDVYSCGY
jgi:hypothetical protein